MSWVVLPVFVPFVLVVVVRARMAVVRGAGRPAGQQAQGVLGGRPGLGGVGEQALAGIGSQRERLECQFDILILNAGAQAMNPIASYAEADWDRLMNLMVKGPFLAMKFAWPQLTRQPAAGSS